MLKKILREEQIWKMLCHPLNIPDFVQEYVVLKAEVDTPESVHEVLSIVCEHNNLKINSDLTGAQCNDFKMVV